MTDELALQQGLTKMRWVATLLLLLMAVVFIVTSIYLPHWPWLGYLRAFSEAAMIGALADWFAVSALFRHPLGLPIPHTAIVPKRKNDIGRSLANFVKNNFLTADVVDQRLGQLDISSKIAGWLRQEKNAQRLSTDLCRVIRWSLETLEGGALETALKSNFRQALSRVSLSDAMSAMLELIATGDHAQTLIDQFVAFGREQLDANRLRIRLRIKEQSPWWLPKFVDEEIYEKLVGELDRILAEIGEDPNHEARDAFNQRLRTLTVAFSEDPTLMEKAEALKEEFINHPAVSEYFATLWDELRVFLLASVSQSETEPPPVARNIAQQLANLGNAIQADESAKVTIDVRARELVSYLLQRYRDPLANVINETIASWDPDATSSRIELYIGRDLQFIRINGTVVGGLVGLALYSLAMWLFPS